MIGIDWNKLTGRSIKIFPVVAFLLLSALFLYAAPRGLGGADEIFYLVWLNDPQAYDLGYHPYGYVLNPIFELLGRSIANIRIFGYILSAVAGACLAFYVDRYCREQYPSHYMGSNFVLLGALCGFGNYAMWLLTPAYNLMANVGFCFFIAGILGWLGHHKYSSLLVAIGGYLSFFGKPPLAVLELFAALFILVKCREPWRKLLVAGVVAGLLLAATILPWNSPAGFIARMTETQRVLGMGNQWWELPVKVARELYSSPPMFFVTATAAGIFILSPQDDKSRRIIIYFLILGCALLFAYKFVWAVEVTKRIHLLGFVAVLVSMLLIALKAPQLPRSAILLCCVLTLAPYFVSIGTYDELNDHLTFHLMFPVFAMMLVAQFAPRNDKTVLAVVAMFVAIITYTAVQTIGSTVAVFKADTPIRNRLFSDSVRVNRPTAHWANSLARIGTENGIRADTPVIDLNGTVPANATFLGGTAPVLPWLFGGTPEWADVIFSNMTEQQKRDAWYITPVAPAFESSLLVKKFRHDLSRYELVGTTQFPAPNGIFPLQVWKPRKEFPARLSTELAGPSR